MKLGGNTVYRNIESKLLFIGLIVLAVSAATYAQALNKVKLDQFFDRLVEKDQAMGSNVIAKDGEVLYGRTIGYSQIGNGENKPIFTETKFTETKFRVGSITKMFTAAIILQLADEAKINLDNKLAKFLPQIPNAEKITIKQILTQRTGIQDIFEDSDLRPNRTEPIAKDELIAIIAKGKSEFEPDTKHSYSNSGYTLLGYIIEELTGKPYGKVLEERIISKIGLENTYLATGKNNVNKNESLSYRRFLWDWWNVTETHPSILYSPGGLISTPYDLVKFNKALFDRKIVSKESLEQMTTIRDGYGLGMETFDFNEKTFYGHTGGIDNFGAWLAYLPEEKLIIVYTSNAKAYPVKHIMSGVIDIYYNKPFEIPALDFDYYAIFLILIFSIFLVLIVILLAVILFKKWKPKKPARQQI